MNVVIFYAILGAIILVGVGVIVLIIPKRRRKRKIEERDIFLNTNPPINEEEQAWIEQQISQEPLTKEEELFISEIPEINQSLTDEDIAWMDRMEENREEGKNLRLVQDKIEKPEEVIVETAPKIVEIIKSVDQYLKDKELSAEERELIESYKVDIEPETISKDEQELMDDFYNSLDY